MASSGNQQPGFGQPAEHIPVNSLEREAVLEQLHRMIAHPLFCNSKRYPGLLRYLVEHTLDGQVEHLKERILGVEVFHRAPSYDTNLDPVVRITAGEVRKRIAQYYFLPGHESEIRIDIRPGSYVPEFYLPTLTSSVPAISLITPPDPSHAELAPVHYSPAARSRRPWRLSAKWLSIMAVVLVVAVASILIAWERPWIRRSALNEFWQPVISTPNPVLVCISDQADFPSGMEDGSSDHPDTKPQISLQQLERSMHRIGLADAITLSRLTAVLQSMGKGFVVKGDKATTLEDLRQGPVVLIGAFDNDWTIRLMKDLRFSFDNEVHSPNARIRDRFNPGQLLWTVNGSAPYMKITEDYAIIARFKDQTSGSLTVVGAGVGMYGTLAAGEVLSSESYLQQIANRAPRNWKTMNMEAVISTQVIRDNSGPPKILETYFW